MAVTVTTNPAAGAAGDAAGVPGGFDAIVFDMDGLILDTEPVYRHAAQRAAAGLGYELSDALYLRMVGRHRAACERILYDSFGEDFPMDPFNAAWPGHWSQHIEENGVDVKPGLLELLDHLDAGGVRRAVATSSDAMRATLCLESAGLVQRFEHVISGDMVVNAKPAPDIYLQAAERLGVSPVNCAAFEDSEPGAQAALAASMSVFVVPDLVQPGDEVRRRAAAVLGSLHEAPDALAGR